MQYIRSQYSILKTRIAEPRKFIQVVVGPRQVGKSTLVSQLLRSQDLPYTLEVADNISPQDTDWIRRTWEAARLTMRLHNAPEYLLVIDEVQKIENWSEAVKREWDADSLNQLNLKVILLGSSRLLIRKGLTESLAGRYELIRLGHWSYNEMHDAFGLSLDQYIYFGGYPGPAHIINDFKRWKKYIKDSLISPAIDKDVILTSNIYKPALMKQLFELGCAYSGEMLSLTKLIARLQDAGNVTTLAAYLDILKECNLLAGLQKYAKDKARKYNSVPKYQVYNNALLTSYKGTTFEEDRINPMTWGRWVESAVGAYLLSMADELEYNLFYWRERNDEVDFIIEHDGKCLAIEVKSGRRGMNSGLPKFNESFNPNRSIVVGTHGILLEDFMSCNIEDLLSFI